MSVKHGEEVFQCRHCGLDDLPLTQIGDPWPFLCAFCRELVTVKTERGQSIFPDAGTVVRS